jgi:ferredoxin-NADP reductase
VIGQGASNSSISVDQNGKLITPREAARSRSGPLLQGGQAGRSCLNRLYSSRKPGLASENYRYGGQLAPGVSARVFGPHGRFDYRRGGRHQLWIGVGVGVTPFHSWIESLDATFDREVEFFYTAPDPEQALFADDIVEAALRHPSLNLHLVASQRQGRLTPEQVAAAVAAPHKDVWVYMCGPLEMMRTFEKQLHRLGFPRRHIV